ncbi:death-on-curing family protein [Candidatus Magnetoovum chiemensis]|nr:death-on-curing family protein [Candidatus Magnetoovum chiemensis]
MECLEFNTITKANRKAIEEKGGSHRILSKETIENIAGYVENTGSMRQWDDIELICLAAYQIIKGHPFLDGNKRTAYGIILGCLKSINKRFTGRHRDLAYKIVEIAKSKSNEKDNMVSGLAYYLKAHLQERQT